MKYADVAQSVEQLIRNQQVAGSSPASSSIEKTLDFPTKIKGFLFAFWLLKRPHFSILAHIWRTSTFPPYYIETLQ